MMARRAAIPQADLLMRRTAVISDCGRYRYRLERRWDDGPMLTFCMLNPSTANAEIDDPTIRRCIGFAKREGAGGLVVINLFALRATDPVKLRESEIHSYGPDNYSATDDALCASRGALPIVCAWGAHACASRAAPAFLEIAAEVSARLVCLGRTQDGSPRHPLYVPANQPFEAFP